MRVSVENRPVRGPERYRMAGVPTGGRDASHVPEVLYPVVLETDEGELEIGAVGSYEAQGGRRWAWYCLVGETKCYLRNRFSAEDAVLGLWEYALKHLPVVDGTRAAP